MNREPVRRLLRAAAISGCSAVIGTVVAFGFAAHEGSATAAAGIVERGFTIGAVAGALVAMIDFRRTSPPE